MIQLCAIAPQPHEFGGRSHCCPTEPSPGCPPRPYGIPRQSSVFVVCWELCLLPKPDILVPRDQGLSEVPRISSPVGSAANRSDSPLAGIYPGSSWTNTRFRPGLVERRRRQNHWTLCHCGTFGKPSDDQRPRRASSRYQSPIIDAGLDVAISSLFILPDDPTFNHHGAARPMGWPRLSRPGRTPLLLGMSSLGDMLHLSRDE